MLGVARMVRMGAHAVAAPGPLEDPRPPRDSEAAQELRGTGDMGSPLKGGNLSMSPKGVSSGCTATVVDECLACLPLSSLGNDPHKWIPAANSLGVQQCGLSSTERLLLSLFGSAGNSAAVAIVTPNGFVDAVGISRNVH
jgi:hypothetical protein